ncbi:CAP domain-containing protein, partial [Scheffersomyces xylosifermentans]|uniref:CAP domain-containing protein n=1 Tax=Scheffersomyces xylosifermentans TaxID=1304137 RepID=UPI00315D8D33
VLEAHNSKREEHGVKPLKWSEEVYKYAQAYADKYDCSGNLQHSLGKYGENLAVGYQDGVSAFNDWYAEGKNYDYSSASVLNHFTAIIWKGTTELGCAYKDCKSKGNGYYIVCSYNPAGNTVNEEKENLFPPK